MKTYHYFHSKWEEKYFFTQVKDKNVCCFVILLSPLLKMHQKTVHSKFQKSFPLYSAIIFLKTVDNKAPIETSNRVSQIIAQNKKPYEDGEMIEQAFLKAADSLFANFKLEIKTT